MAVGAAGAAVPAVVVVMATGTVARFVAVKVNGPPKAPTVVFWIETVAGFGALVNVQLIWAKAMRFAAGIVSTFEASVPKLAGFSVTAEFASVQVAVDKSKLLLAASVTVTGLTVVVTVIGTGVVGAGVPTVVVVMLLMVPVKFVAVKLKGPPTIPVVIFLMATVGMAGLAMLEKLQTIWALALTRAEGIVNTLPLSVPNAVVGLPEAAALLSRQEAAFIVKLVASVSVITTAVLFAVTATGAKTVG